MDSPNEGDPQMNQAQELFLRLIEIGSHNLFDGVKIGQDVRANTDLWKAVLFTRSDVGIIVRDLSDGVYNADTLYLVPSSGKEDELWSLAAEWRADEMRWIGDEESQDFLMDFSNGTDGPKAVLYLWWD